MLWGILLNRVSFVDTEQWLPQNTTMKGHSQHNHSLIGGKNQAKFENDCVLTNGHTCRSKITQSNLMILVSFSSASVAWFEDVKRYGTFRSQATENLLFRFLWDTRYSFKGNSRYPRYAIWPRAGACHANHACAALTVSRCCRLEFVFFPLKMYTGITKILEFEYKTCMFSKIPSWFIETFGCIFKIWVVYFIRSQN